MKLDTILQQCFLLAITVLSISLVITEPVPIDSVEPDEVNSAETEGKFVYVMTDPRQRRNGLSLLQPPNVYHQKFAQFLDKAPSKRDGFWIWMPAQGYVSVPRQGGSAGGPGKGGSNSNILRYG